MTVAGKATADGWGQPLRLVKKLERTIAQGHPWLWRDAVEPHGHLPGSVVRVVDKRGQFLARGLVESGPIGVRIFTLLETEALDADLIARRIRAAVALRSRVVPAGTDALSAPLATVGTVPRASSSALPIRGARSYDRLVRSL